jgi:GalNAc-alpha-(1->4)-GalNAc-alpha-(1->3)-diNAcBac-PP-undecaprenol alpha-1,4-N-acetyl-D-galactosaminyltransferase
VRILPGCPPTQIWDYFAASDVFAFPSFREGMPNSLLEAMMAGLPAVAFGIPSIQDISRFGDGLMQVPPFEFSAFGEGLQRLIADPSLRRQIGERGRALARRHFSIESNMQSAVARISRLVRQPPRDGHEP